MSKEQDSYRNVSENPCNMCMPLGGIIAFKGIERSMVIVHGSQGCSTYMRRAISEHYNEPVDVASSSLNEKGTIYGGEANLKKGLDNVLKVYRPKLIGVLTTCLAETIGEDIDRITKEYLEERQLRDIAVVTAATPGYGGTHADGYFFTLRSIVSHLGKKAPKHSRINIIIPHISPADIREIKRLLRIMGVEYTLLPDYSDTLDAPYSRVYDKIPAGGTRLEEISAMTGAVATIEVAVTVDQSWSAGKFLASEYGVPLYRIPIPMGVENTDTLIGVLREITGQGMPDILKVERGRLLDAMIDSHKHNFQGRAVIFGDPEQILALAGICLENGVFPAVIATGSRTGRIQELMQDHLDKFGENNVILNDTDFSHIREKCRQMGVNLALGNSDGRYLTERDRIPLVRTGFPIHDRMGGQRLLSVGYQGSVALLDRITNTLLENKYDNYRAEMYRKFYTGAS